MPEELSRRNFNQDTRMLPKAHPTRLGNRGQLALDDDLPEKRMLSPQRRLRMLV